MCWCEKPTINGPESSSIKEPNPPVVPDGAIVVFDEPGRCGGVDCHTHHYTVIEENGRYSLLIRHGRDERIQLSNGKAVVAVLEALDSNGRFWVLNAMYRAHADAARAAREQEKTEWQSAAAEKRIKTRRWRGQNMVQVWIEPQMTGAGNSDSEIN